MRYKYYVRLTTIKVLVICSVALYALQTTTAEKWDPVGITSAIVVPNVAVFS